MSQTYASVEGPMAISPAVRSFRTQYNIQNRQKKRGNLIYAALFLVLFFISAYIGNFDPQTIIQGIPRLHEYVEKTIPVLRWDHFWHDISEWFFLINVWMELLLETILIAFLASAISIFMLLSSAFRPPRT